jgi:hypothetical protein
MRSDSVRLRLRKSRKELDSSSLNTAIAQTMIFVNDSPARNASLPHDPPSWNSKPSELN